MTGGLINLQALVAKAQTTVKQQDALKKATTTLKTAVSATKRAQVIEEIQALSSALVFKLQYWHCLCDRKGTTPLGMFVQQKHVRMANSTRLVRPRSENVSEHHLLPRYTQREYISVLMCGVCSVTDHSFGTELPVPLPIGVTPAPVRGAFTEEWETLTAPEPETEDEPDTEPDDAEDPDTDL